MASNNSFFVTDEPDVIEYNLTESTMPGSTVLTVTICIAGLLANSLIIIVVLYGSLKNLVIMNLLLALAVTDNLYLMFIVEKQRGILGEFIIGSSLLHCRLTVFLVFASGTISSWITVFMALERFIAIFYPFKVHIFCTIWKANFTICVITALGLLSLIPLFYTCSVIPVGEIHACGVQGKNAKTDLLVILPVNLLYSIILFILITILNAFIIKRIRSQRAFRIRSPGHTSKLAARDASLVSMMTAVSMVFVITIFPSSLLNIYSFSHRYIHGTEFNYEGWLPRGLFILEDINHCINFFLYCITGSVFRTALFQLLTCKRRQSDHGQSHQMITISQNVNESQYRL